jgi:lipopolysaccharide transport system permease protein
MATAVAEPTDTTTPAGEPPRGPRTVIEPPRGWQPVDVRELWRHRELLAFLAWRDVKVRYKQTVLGAAWAVLQPLLTMAVFVVFFGRMAKVPTGDVEPPLFFLSGILPWFLFANAVTAAANSVLGSERLITKIYFPRLAVPFAAAGAAAVDFAVACGLLAVVSVGYGVWPTAAVVAAPLAAGLILLLAVGLGTLLAALNVSFRDFRYVVPFLIQLGMFATPTIYMQPTGDDGGAVAALLALNPMTALVSAFRAGVVGGPVPWAGLAVAAAVAAGVFVGGCLVFRRAEDRFADVI